MLRIPRQHAFPLLALVACTLTISAASKTKPKPDAAKELPKAVATSPAVDASGWTEVDYGPLVDRRRLTHSGESIGTLLDRLGGRPLPKGGERPDDLLTFQLLDPMLEPYAFVMQDALDTLGPAPAAPLVEVGDLYRPGEAQPAWAALLRARNLIVESDGAGHVRAFLPAVEGGAADSASAAREAWDASWPVLRHVLAAEKRRLAGRPLEVEVHPYVHLPARSIFRLGVAAHRVSVDDTHPLGDAPPLDLAALASAIEGGNQLEGGRLDADGNVQWLFSKPKQPPRMLGRPLELSDVAVAYRAVFHGGLAEPYMSLDRGGSPQFSVVNYGGRLEDTSLGLVSLLCDVRFKTFSVGVDILRGADVRDEVRRTVPGFRTHLERFAADPASRDVPAQQTRLWFYPDDVDLTLSESGDVLAVRKARMTAASERLTATQSGSGEPDRPWTAATIGEINQDHVELASVFPEIGGLDQGARLLSLFTWLRQAKLDGLAVPDLDALLAVPLPPVPTPRSFPQLLSYNVLPAGTTGSLDVFDRVDVGEGLERLLPASGAQLPAARRLARALQSLDRSVPEQAALAKEIESTDTTAASESAIDVLSFRAERLAMHALVLATLPASDRAGVEARRKSKDGARVFSVGIGGIDLGMGKALARAKRGGRGLSLDGTSRGGRGRGASPARVTGEKEPAAAPAARQPVAAKDAWRIDTAGLPAGVLPDHGLGPQAIPVTTTWGEVRNRELPSHATQAGSYAGDPKVSWVETVMGIDGIEPRMRRVVRDAKGGPPTFERLEAGRALRYRFGSEPGMLRAMAVTSPALPPDAAVAARYPRASLPAVASPTSGEPPKLTILELLPSDATTMSAGAGTVAATVAAPPASEPASLRLRLRSPGGKDLEASFPRSVLKRVVLGPEADPLVGRPLPGFTPPQQILGGAEALMFALSPEESSPPWDPRSGPVAGEEDPATLARALARWWLRDPSGAVAGGVFVGVDPDRSPARWSRAPKAGAKAVLLLPEDAFPGVEATARRAALAAAWSQGTIVTAPEQSSDATLVVLVSAEAPDALASRLRALSRSDALRGKLLAILSLSGTIRRDLPGSLLVEGTLAGIGVAEASVVGRARAVEDVRAYASALAARPERRVEAIASPFLWYF